jgi:hypothetical protein
MKRHEALPSKYLSKEDFETPATCQIKEVVSEEVQGEHGMETKPVLYIDQANTAVDKARGIIVNGTNWDSIVEITDENDSDNWGGKLVEIYHEPNVMFGRKKVGGIRVREASTDSAAAFN